MLIMPEGGLMSGACSEIQNYNISDFVIEYSDPIQLHFGNTGNSTPLNYIRDSNYSLSFYLLKYTLVILQLLEMGII